MSSVPILSSPFFGVQVSISSLAYTISTCFRPIFRSLHGSFSIRWHRTYRSFAHCIPTHATTSGGTTYNTCPPTLLTVRDMAPAFQKWCVTPIRLGASLYVIWPCCLGSSGTVRVAQAGLGRDVKPPLCTGGGIPLWPQQRTGRCLEEQQV